MNYELRIMMKKNIQICLALAAIFLGIAGVSASAQDIKAQDDAAKAKYQEAWGQYQKEANFFKTVRQEFLSARTKFQEARNTANRSALEEKTKSFLEKAVTSLIKKLEALKTWVSNHRALPEDAKQSISSDIDKDINWLRERLMKIQGATPEQIKEEAKTIRQYWRTHRIKVKKIIGQIWVGRVSFVIIKAEDFAAKLGVKINELKAAGKDTAQLEAYLLEFNQHIVLAKEKYEAAKAKFAEIKAEVGTDFESELKAAEELFKAGHQFVKEANRHIKDAHAKLRQIVNEMKKAGKAVEASVE